MSNPAIETPESAPAADARPYAAPAPATLLAAKGGGIAFTGKLVTFACRFAITFLLARLMGAGQYGLYNLGQTALTIAAGLAVFGMDSALVRYIAIYHGRRDEAGLWGVLQAGLGTAAVLGVALGAGLHLLAEPIAARVFDEPQLAPVLRVAGLLAPFLALNIVLAAATQGFKQMQHATIARDIVQPLIRLALIVALAAVGLSAVGALTVYGVAIAATSIQLLLSLNRLFALRRPLRQARHRLRELLNFSLPVHLSDLMTTFRENVQTLLLGALNTVTSVGLFAVANQVNLIGHFFHTSLVAASNPIISELHDRGDRTQLARMYQTTTKWSFTVNLPLFLTMALFPAAVMSIFGASFADGATALVLLAGANMLDAATGTCGSIIDMTGHTRLKLVNALVRLGLSLGLSALLIPPWGVLGAAVAALLVVGTTNLLRLAEVFVLFRMLPYNASFVKPILAGAAALGTALALDRALPTAAQPAYAALHTAALLAVYAGAILALGLGPEDRAVLARVRARLGRGKGKGRKR
ncbi:MAG TPA: flippase [Roseiflexaceae bacterium]|nr:flippase [Roseiflexaceae bacterium]